MKILFIFLISFISFAQAEDMFSIRLTVDNITQDFTNTNAENMLEYADETDLRANFPNYTTNSEVTGAGNFRGLAFSIRYPSNSPIIILNIPEISVAEIFAGATRDESQELLEDYIKNNRNNVLEKMQRYLIENTPFDPIAGNPSSLESFLVESDFLEGIETEIGLTQEDAGDIPQNSFDLGLRFGSLQAQGKNINSFTLPLKYTLTFREDPRKQIFFKLPITVSDTEGSSAYKVALGTGFRFPINDKWSLTPAISYGILGSDDLAAKGQIASISMTSSYTFMPKENMAIKIGNMLGFYKTLPIDGTDVDIQNTVLKNGVLLSTKRKIGARDFLIHAFITDTHFFGDDIFVQNYQEIGFSMGTLKKQRWADRLQFGASYLFSADESDVKRFMFNIGYSF